jgi:hypothetical protein
MRPSQRPGPRILTLAFALFAAGPLPGCHKKTAPPGPSAAAVRQSFDGVKQQFAGLQQRSAELGKQVEALPADLPGYPQLRASFYAFEEARGVTDAKVTLLSARLDAAVSSGRPEELQRLASDLLGAQKDAGQIDQLYLKLLHQVMAFQRAADHRKQALAASGAPSPPASAQPPAPRR